MSVPDKIYAWESDGPEVIANFLKLNKDQVEYIRAKLVNDLIDAIEILGDPHIDNAIKAIRGEE